MATTLKDATQTGIDLANSLKKPVATKPELSHGRKFHEGNILTEAQSEENKTLHRRELLQKASPTAARELAEAEAKAAEAIRAAEEKEQAELQAIETIRMIQDGLPSENKMLNELLQLQAHGKNADALLKEAVGHYVTHLRNDDPTPLILFNNKALEALKVKAVLPFLAEAIAKAEKRIAESHDRVKEIAAEHGIDVEKL
jgi:wobble nucleotide-excising tRNase